MLYERYGYDEARIARQLSLSNLTVADHALVESLHADIILPRAKTIMARLYALLRRDRRLWKGHASSLPRLQSSLLTALRTLGRDFDTTGYFETRLRAGEMHARCHVPLELYVGAARLLGQELVDAVPAHHPDGPALRRLVLKLVMLDIAVVTETYHQATLAELERQLQRTRSDVRVQRERARRDSLTEVFRREFVEEALDAAIEAARESGDPLSIAMIDIDHFKRFNDGHGHTTGDEILRLTAERMRLATRDNDTLGRYGGEEFLLVLRGVGPGAAYEIVERLRECVAEEPVRVGALTIQVTISAGVTALDPVDKDRVSLIERADRALYLAKAEGRDRVCLREGRTHRAAKPTEPFAALFPAKQEAS